ncbi:MAG: YcxB family protein [Alphaproteobacteria bacterium]|nr:YcxB family protein [Alphaproteobacteria bacterium]
MAGKVHVQLGEGDFIAGTQLHAFRAPRLWVIAGVVVVLVLLADYNVYSGSGEHSYLLLGLGVLYALTLLVFVPYVILPWRARKQFRQVTTARDPFDIVWDDETLTITAADWMQKSRWDDFVKSREDAQLILLYISDFSFRIVPRRAFADAAALDDFLRLARAKAGRKKA